MKQESEYYFMDARAGILKGLDEKPVVITDKVAALKKLKELKEDQPGREWIVQPPIYDFEE